MNVYAMLLNDSPEAIVRIINLMRLAPLRNTFGDDQIAAVLMWALAPTTQEVLQGWAQICHQSVFVCAFYSIVNARLFK
jgi:hypothetical protein